ncbi:hypothetical protein C5B99_12405 [Pseudoclavibacter sp. Z016]|nr:hypothetical protein C5B99_12405 [Pseudoclavibacter sp. Z016]
MAPWRKILLGFSRRRFRVQLGGFGWVEQAKLLEAMATDGAPLGVSRACRVDVVQHLEEPLFLEAATGFEERVLA